MPGAKFSYFTLLNHIAVVNLSDELFSIQLKGSRNASPTLLNVCPKNLQSQSSNKSLVVPSVSVKTLGPSRDGPEQGNC